MPDAGNHLRKAVKLYPAFSDACVLLGQVSNYLPAYLCLTVISARLNNWDEVLKLSSRALELDPADSAAFYVNSATANFECFSQSRSRARKPDCNPSSADVAGTAGTRTGSLIA